MAKAQRANASKARAQVKQPQESGQIGNRLGLVDVGTPWPDLRSEDVSIEVDIQKPHLRMRIGLRLSKRSFLVLCLMFVFVYWGITHNKRISGEVNRMMKIVFRE